MEKIKEAWKNMLEEKGKKEPPGFGKFKGGPPFDAGKGFGFGPLGCKKPDGKPSPAAKQASTEELLQQILHELKAILHEVKGLRKDLSKK
jgi:hypothetical protein